MLKGDAEDGKERRVAGGRRLLLGLLRFIGPSMWIGRLALGGPMPIAGDSSLSKMHRGSLN